MWKSIGHFFTAMTQYIIKGAKAVEAQAPKIVQAGQTIEAITTLLYPAAAPLEDLLLRTFGDVVGAAHGTDVAAGAQFVNIQLDAALVAEIKAIIPDIQAFATLIGAQKPPAAKALPAPAPKVIQGQVAGPVPVPSPAK